MDNERITIKVNKKVAKQAKEHCATKHIIYEKWCSDALKEKLTKEKYK
jgi:hypothetical protein